jgi:hypothetical protein
VAGRFPRIHVFGSEYVMAKTRIRIRDSQDFPLRFAAQPSSIRKTMSRPCPNATVSNQQVSTPNPKQEVGVKLSVTLKNEGWWTGTQRTIDVIDTPQHEQRTDEWFEAREECYITGSRVDTLLNNNPWSTIYQEVNRTAGLLPDKSDWKQETKDGVVKYKNPYQPKLDLDAKKLSKLHVSLPVSFLYVILDIEHTEGCYDGIQIIQLAAKLADINGRTLNVDPFNELINTSRPIVDRCGHNITKKDLEGRDTFDKVGQRFIDWIDIAARRYDITNVMFVAYNGFTCDFRFLAREFERNNLVLPKQYHYLCIDPLKYVQNEKNGFFKDVPRQTEAGKPCLKLKDVTTYILTERERYHEDRERYQGGDVLFERLCGKAHDAMADVEALHIVLSDPTVWNQKKAIKFDNFTQFAETFGYYEREFAVTSPIDNNHEATNHGNMYEKDAWKKYVKETYKNNGIDCKYIEIGFVKHPFYSYMGASPDGLLLFKDRAPILIEIKCPYSIYDSGGKLERSNMNKYRGQMQLQMHVMGVDECHFVQYNPDTGELIYDVVFIDPDFMNNPIFPQFVVDVESRKNRLSREEDEPLKSKKRKRLI